MNHPLLALLAAMPAVLVAAGCSGSSSRHASSPASTRTAQTTTAQQSTTTSSASPGALQAEAQSAVAGDIPDNQVYLVFRSSVWSMKYPEGWARSGTPNATVFRDKNNIARVVIGPGTLPTPAKVRSDPALKRVQITSAPSTVRLAGQRAIKVVYSTKSAPNSVTGKRVTLTVDRYYLAHGGKVATLDLGTPVGVDNVDAYRLMSQSFRWR